MSSKLISILFILTEFFSQIKVTHKKLHLIYTDKTVFRPFFQRKIPEKPSTERTWVTWEKFFCLLGEEKERQNGVDDARRAEPAIRMRSSG